MQTKVWLFLQCTHMIVATVATCVMYLSYQTLVFVYLSQPYMHNIQLPPQVLCMHIHAFDLIIAQGLGQAWELAKPKFTSDRWIIKTHSYCMIYNIPVLLQFNPKLVSVNSSVHKSYRSFLYGGQEMTIQSVMAYLQFGIIGQLFFISCILETKFLFFPFLFYGTIVRLSLSLASRY